MVETIDLTFSFLPRLTKNASRQQLSIRGGCKPNHEGDVELNLGRTASLAVGFNYFSYGIIVRLKDIWKSRLSPAFFTPWLTS
jgi:hypothetical protein